MEGRERKDMKEKLEKEKCQMIHTKKKIKLNVESIV